MIAVIQRVTEATVKINGKLEGQISNGLVVLLGIAEGDDKQDVDWLSRKIANMRLFSDENGIMNKSLIEVHAEILLISQFTLHASTKKGNRPSYLKAARPELAIPLYEQMISALNSQIPTEVKTGRFGANMQVSLINNGPVTIIIDSKDRK